MYKNVRMAPTSTTNITGFFHWTSGLNIKNASFKAGTAMSMEKSGLCRIFLRAEWVLAGESGAEAVVSMEFPLLV